MEMMIWIVFLHLISLWGKTALAAQDTMPGCQEKCGNISVPYPFGIIGDPRCYREEMGLRCDYSSNPPQLFLDRARTTKVLGISLQGQIRINNFVASDCYNKTGARMGRRNAWVNLNNTPYSISDKLNRFTAIGCDTLAYITGSKEQRYRGGCVSVCDNQESIIDGDCSGIGCCQTSIAKGFKRVRADITSFANHRRIWEFNPCSYAFVVEQSWFKFSVLDLSNFQGRNRVPVVLDWAIGNKSCEEVLRGDREHYACRNNSYCSNSTNGPGYLCYCNKGYHGNPYLANGCQDIDECADDDNNDCEGICTNVPGGYLCSCPPGTYDEGEQDGQRCIAVPDEKDFPLIKVTIGTGLGLLFLFIGSIWLYCGLRKRKLIRLREKFFEKNGGLLLQHQMSTLEGAVETARVFTAEELEKATDNYSENRILGKGGYGTVYKGILPNQSIVAIKKSIVVDESQIEQFINEVVILSQINHRNVVKLLGCCLETEVPSLIYEFINNNTLFHHIHDEDHTSSLSWETRLRIAAETAGALAYLHSATSVPVIHRDIKSINILVDENFIAKVADFGASRLVPLDQTQLTTLVQGTLGYLDPEYFHTSQLTEKSDVYSFGVVLAELLTGKKALSFERNPEERNLSMHFVSSMKENRLFEVLEERVVKEGKKEQLQQVGEVARRCLRVKREARPMMKEVAAELDAMRKIEKHPWIEEDGEETEYLLGELTQLESDGGGYSGGGYDSLQGQLTFSIDNVR